MNINVANNYTISVGANTETIGVMKNTAVSLDMLTMVTGKLTEVIQRDKEIQTEKKNNVNSQNSILTHPISR